MGDCLISQKRWPEADVACQKAIALSPRLPEAHLLLGIQRLQVARYYEALVSLKKASQLVSAKDPLQKEIQGQIRVCQDRLAGKLPAKDFPAEHDALIAYQLGPEMQVGLTARPRDRITYAADGNTGSTVVKVDGASAVFGSSAGQWNPKLEPLGKGPDGKDRLGHRSVWVHKHIHFTQAVEIMPDEKKALNVCRVTYNWVNKDTQPHTVGLRTLVDTYIVNNDGHPFAVAPWKELITTQADFKGKEVPAVVKALQRADLKDPGLTAHFTLDLGAGIPGPDRFCITHWTQQCRIWEIPVRDIADDAAVVLYWNPVEVPAGGTRSAGFAYGLGRLPRTK
jgi:hypothetical protein